MTKVSPDVLNMIFHFCFNVFFDYSRLLLLFNSATLKLMIRNEYKSTTPVAISASLCRSCRISHFDYDICRQCTNAFKIPTGILAWFPATMITAIVSPIARPMPSTIPAITPDFAAGITIRKILLSWVAPSRELLHNNGSARRGSPLLSFR